MIPPVTPLDRRPLPPFTHRPFLHFFQWFFCGRAPGPTPPPPHLSFPTPFETRKRTPPGVHSSLVPKIIYPPPNFANFFSQKSSQISVEILPPTLASSCPALLSTLSQYARWAGSVHYDVPLSYALPHPPAIFFFFSLYPTISFDPYCMGCHPLFFVRCPLLPFPHRHFPPGSSQPTKFCRNQRPPFPLPLLPHPLFC